MKPEPSWSGGAGASTPPESAVESSGELEEVSLAASGSCCFALALMSGKITVEARPLLTCTSERVAPPLSRGCIPFGMVATSRVTE